MLPFLFLLLRKRDGTLRISKRNYCLFAENGNTPRKRRRYIVTKIVGAGVQYLPIDVEFDAGIRHFQVFLTQDRWKVATKHSLYIHEIY